MAPHILRPDEPHPTCQSYPSLAVLCPLLGLHMELGPASKDSYISEQIWGGQDLLLVSSQGSPKGTSLQKV